MKNNKQEIKCQVFDCAFCDSNECKCSLDKIEVCNCAPDNSKEATMCNSYKKSKHND